MNVMLQAREAQDVLNNAAPRVVVTEHSQLPLVEEIWPECPHLQQLVVTDAEIRGTNSRRASCARTGISTHSCATSS